MTKKNIDIAAGIIVRMLPDLPIDSLLMVREAMNKAIAKARRG